MFDINEVPYAEWLEKSLQAIVPLKPVCLCFAATMPDGEVYTGYYNADATDKAVIAHNIQADIKVLAELNACSVKEIRQVLVGEGVLPRETEIPGEPKKAAKKRFDEETARMLYEEGLDDAAIAKATGMTAHTVAKWRSRNGLRKKARKPRMKKQVDVPSTKPSEAEPDVQKISVVGEAVEVTEPDFTKNAAPEPRTVTVEELRALLEDACRDGLGECAVLVEGTAFADLWLDVHSTLRIYESGERTVELKGTAKSA